MVTQGLCADLFSLSLRSMESRLVRSETGYLCRRAYTQVIGFTILLFQPKQLSAITPYTIAKQLLNGSQVHITYLHVAIPLGYSGQQLLYLEREKRNR